MKKLYNIIANPINTITIDSALLKDVEFENDDALIAGIIIPNINGIHNA